MFQEPGCTFPSPEPFQRVRSDLGLGSCWQPRTGFQQSPEQIKRQKGSTGRTELEAEGARTPACSDHRAKGNTPPGHFPLAPWSRFRQLSSLHSGDHLGGSAVG